MLSKRGRRTIGLCEAILWRRRCSKMKQRASCLSFCVSRTAFPIVRLFADFLTKSCDSGINVDGSDRQPRRDRRSRSVHHIHDAESTADVSTAASHPNLFIHLDGAWGGVYLALPECRPESFFDIINQRCKDSTDGVRAGEIGSFCTNLHKAGLVTFDASCLWSVASLQTLRLLLTSPNPG